METSSVCFYSSMSEHCGSGKDKADSVESKAMGRYLENELFVPEGCMEIVDLQVMKEGSLKMLARNSDYELMLYQSSDKGKTWEEGCRFFRCGRGIHL